MNQFSPEAAKELKHYVYRLIDPRNGETFYVGKGQNSRVFAHLKEQPGPGEDEESAKIRRIREIKIADLKPLHIIHRHGMAENEALQVEAALIDCYPGLSNEVAGHGVEFGPAHAKEIEARYALETMIIKRDHNVIAINVKRSINNIPIYDAVRRFWKMSICRARRAHYVLAVQNGVCREVFVPQEWLRATHENFPEFLNEDSENDQTRIGFKGTLASEDIRLLYRNKRLPPDLRGAKGAANPIRYSYC